MGYLQKNILKHFIECESEEVESATHIAKELRQLQPAVARSVRQLEHQHYLTKNPENKKRGQIELTLTELGALSALLFDVDFDEWKRFMQKKFPQEIRTLEQFQTLIGMRHKQIEILKLAADYMLRHEFFVQGKSRADISKEEIEKMTHYLVTAILRYEPENTTVMKFFNKYNIDKRFVKELLQKQRDQIDKTLDTLGV